MMTFVQQGSILKSKMWGRSVSHKSQYQALSLVKFYAKFRVKSNYMLSIKYQKKKPQRRSYILYIENVI